MLKPAYLIVAFAFSVKLASAIQFMCDDEEWGPKDVIRTGSFPVRTSFGDLYGDERMTELGSWTLLA